MAWTRAQPPKPKAMSATSQPSHNSFLVQGHNGFSVEEADDASCARPISLRRHAPIYRADWRGQISTFPPVGTAPPAMPVRYSSRHPLLTGRHPLASQSTCPVAVTACRAGVGAATAVLLPPRTASKITAFVAKKRLNIASSCRGLTVLIRCHLRLQGKRGQDVTAAAL